MGYPEGYSSRIGFGGRLTPVVKALLIANGVVFGVQLLLYAMGSPDAERTFVELFALTPRVAIEKLRVWQFITHSFLHDVGNLFHILMNMLLLWMFGCHVELVLGRRRFLTLYFTAVLAGGICMIPWYGATILGASAAVFGVTAMFARLFPHQQVLVWGVVPVKARTLVFVLVGIDLLLAIQGSNTGTAHLAHVGGFVIGWFYLSLERGFLQLKRGQEFRRKARDERHAANVRQSVDELLAKVGREGLRSLSWSERAFLKRASKQFRK